MAKYTKKELDVAIAIYMAYLQGLTKQEVIIVLCKAAKRFYPTALVEVHNPQAKIYTGTNPSPPTREED